jgi:hypothetical protein
MKLKPGESVQGFIPATEVDIDADTVGETNLIPWTESAYIGDDNDPNPKVFGDVAVPQNVVQTMAQGLPAPTRRTSRQRYEVLVRRLMAAGRESVGLFGYPVWPASIQRVLSELGFKPDDVDLNAQVYALAKHYIVKAENQQRASNAKKVTLDYHGHFD